MTTVRTTRIITMISIALSLTTISSTSSSPLFLWPVPKEVSTQGKANVIIDRENFEISSPNVEILKRASQRYESIIRTSAPAPSPPAQCAWQTANVPCSADTDCSSWVQENCHPASTIQSYCKTNNFCHFSGSSLSSIFSSISQLNISVSSNNETLSIETNESYSITIQDSLILLKSPTIFGAIRGLETFSQLSSQPSLDADLIIHDTPMFPHRGLSVDASRRYLPISLLESLIDGLSYSKLNVLHLHFSDEPAFRVELSSFPELTKDLGSAVYSKQDIQSLIEYAKDRGVRVIPEIDVPGHAGGFRVLGNDRIDFCDDEKNTLRGTNKTFETLRTIFTEITSIFEDEYVHVGMDEVCKHDTCPSGCSFDDVHAFEKNIQQMIIDLKKIPIGWNDVFTDPKTSEPNAALPQTLIQNWGKEAPEVFAKTNSVIDSTYREMYLNQQCCTLTLNSTVGNTNYFCYYRNHTGPNMMDIQNFLGGETAMWSDSYCPSPHCNINGTYGWMYDSSQDKVFSESYSNMIFPHASAAAGSLWSGYSENLVPKGLPSDMFIDMLDAHNIRLQSRNVSSCSTGCQCDWGSSCIGNASAFYGGHETKLNEHIELRNTGCDFDVKVKSRSPCSKLNEADLAILSPNGGSYVVQGSDFILTASHDGLKVSDQFSLWIGDSTWMDVNLVLNVTCDDGSYIYMTPV